MKVLRETQFTQQIFRSRDRIVPKNLRINVVNALRRYLNDGLSGGWKGGCDV